MNYHYVWIVIFLINLYVLCVAAFVMPESMHRAKDDKDAKDHTASGAFSKVRA